MCCKGGRPALRRVAEAKIVIFQNDQRGAGRFFGYPCRFDGRSRSRAFDTQAFLDPPGRRLAVQRRFLSVLVLGPEGVDMSVGGSTGRKTNIADRKVWAMDHKVERVETREGRLQSPRGERPRGRSRLDSTGNGPLDSCPEDRSLSRLCRNKRDFESMQISPLTRMGDASLLFSIGPPMWAIMLLSRQVHNIIFFERAST